MKNIQIAESTKGTTTNFHSGNVIMEDGRLRMDYDLSDFRVVSRKNGTKALVYKWKEKLANAETNGFIVDHEGEALRVYDTSISFSLMDDETRAIRNPKAAKAEVSKCRAEFNKLLKGTWTREQAVNFLNNADPTLRVRGKQITDPIFQMAFNIAASGKPERIVTFREWVNGRIIEEADKASGNQPSASQLMALVPTLLGQSLADMSVQDQVETMATTLVDKYDDLLALYTAKQEEKRAKLAAARAAAAK